LLYRFSFLGLCSLSNENQGEEGHGIRFEFNPQAVNRGVHIVRVIIKYTPLGARPVRRYLKLRAVIGSPEDHQTLQPVSDFVPMRREELRDDWHKVHMIKEKSTRHTMDFGKLEYYDVPLEFWKQAQAVVESPSNAKILLRSQLPHEFKIQTYNTHWKHLLWHEEIAMW
jgi:hypothetical protein